MLLSGQKAFSDIGLIESEASALLEARLTQRDEELSRRFSQAEIARTDAEPTPGLFSPQTNATPIDIELDSWQADGLISGEDDLGKGTTLVFAYTVDITFRNRLTRETRVVRSGQRAVSRGLGMTLAVLSGSPRHN
ncbi:hypothetical protein CSA57_01040 [candidate division KSB3 bacterium]|nr:MAG: hypothetical protein CSA57_01040 [candidate division KSB3 bacterium]